jgi:pimeloyl-ACP methyl ester carboxylesterase
MRPRPIVLSLLVALVAAVLPAVAQSAPLKDSEDPFYRWEKPLEAVPPGTVLRRREVQVGAAGITTPVTATQVLYRTTKQSGRAVTTVATVIRPLAGGTTKLLSYQMAYNDLGSTCTPSYRLQGGGGADATGLLETGFIAAYVAQGYTVVAPDFEGFTHDYTAGQGAGWAVLDGIRAARSVLGVPEGTPAGLIGYSGGGIASQWAGELAPEYAPETNLVGTASGAPAVHYPNTINYVEGSQDWASVLPYLLIGLFRGAEVDITKYLSPRGLQILDQVKDKCLDTGAFPGLRLTDMLVDGRDWKTIRPLVKVINTQIMGSRGTPRAPLFLGNGNVDGIGDGIMISADIESLAHQYCRKGLPVRYSRYPASDHVVGIPQFEAEAILFLQERFNGLPVVSNCDAIPPGRSLAPLPLPPLPALSLDRARRTSKGYRLAVRVDREALTDVSVSLYAVRSGKRKRVATARPTGAVGTDRRVLAVPLRRGVPGRSYEVVVKGEADDEVVSAKRAFRVPRRR